MSGHREEVRTYYEQNTRRFLARGQGGAEGVIHRAVWGEGVEDRTQAFHFIHELVARELPSFRPVRVVDLGCGVGACLRYLARDPEVQGTGVTLSPVQVRLAREAGEREGLSDRLDFLEGDFTALPPLEPGHVVCAIESFLHGPDPASFLAQASHVLIPGGKLAICDDFLGDRPPGNAREREALGRFRRGWHVGTLERVETLDMIAARYGLRRIRDLDLTDFLELGRPRDRVISAIVRLGRAVGARGKYFASLVGGDALQTCLRKRLVTYRFVVWEKTAS
jgi:SAM-dependent methyltransferase